MSSIWSYGIHCAVALTFDVDGEAGILQVDSKSAERLSSLSWARYGPRVGAYRILDLLRDKGVKATFFFPGYTAELYPSLVEQIDRDGHEIGIHGYMHEPLSTLSPEAEEETLVRTIDILEGITGRKPVGYRAPLWDLNLDLPALLARHGLLYDSSLMDDDKPYAIATAAGKLIELPVHWTNDDWEQFGYLMNPAIGSGVIETCEKAFQLWKEEFDGMYRYGGAFVLTMHPEITGRPARVMMLERLIDYIQSHEGVWMTTCAEIARYTLSHQNAARPEILANAS